MEQDINLLASVASHDTQAFTQLYNQIYPLVYRYIFMKTGNQHVSEDIVSTVFEVILGNIDKYDSKQSAFKTWAFGIANHKLADYWRNANNRQLSLDEFDVQDQTSGENPGDLDNSLMLKQIYLSLKKLPETEAEVVRLKYYSNLSNSEIASILSISENSVPSLSTRAIKKLSTIIN